VAYGEAQGPGGPVAYGEAQGPGGPGAYAGAQAPGAGGTGGGSLWGGAPGGAPEGEPGFPLPLPGGQGPGRRSQRSKVLNRNTVGIAAAIALVAGYLGVAAVAHLSPFPAKAAPPAQPQSQTSSPAATTSSSAASSPASSPAQTPTSQRSILLAKIPATVRSSGDCLDNGTAFGATAVIQCQQLQGLAANTIIYYLFPSRAALASGFSQALTSFHFHRAGECMTNGDFTDFIVNCQSDFTSKKGGVTGSVAEYPVKGSNAPVIVSTDNQQNVMAVMVGTNDGDLLTFWKQLAWVVLSQ
jgi:hypothetical protein